MAQACEAVGPVLNTLAAADCYVSRNGGTTPRPESSSIIGSASARELPF